MKELWILLFVLDTNYRGMMLISPIQPLSVSEPTPLVISRPMDSEQDCKKVQQVLRENMKLSQVNCLKVKDNVLTPVK